MPHHHSEPQPPHHSRALPSPTSGFLAIQPHILPVLTFATETEAILFQEHCHKSWIDPHNRTWVYLPFPPGLKKGHYTLSTHHFGFEFHTGDQAEAFALSLHMKDWVDKSIGDVKIHYDTEHPSQNYFSVGIKRN